MNAPGSRGIAFTLRWGAYLSAGLLAIGVLWLLTASDVPLQIGPAMPLRALGGQLAQGNPYAVMQVGLLLLLVTPLVRLVMGSVSYFGRDWRYVLVSLAALGLILLSVLLARGG
ncbi:MAG: DUF1634 domain-containing protein [Candidatus Acidoferrales bacterium]